MQQYAKKAIVILLFWVGLIGAHTQVQAYVLPGLHILELLAQKFQASQNLSISQTLILYDDTPGGGGEFIENIRYFFPEAFRSDIVSENVQRIHVLAKGVALTIIDGKVAAQSETRYDRYKDIILYNSRVLLEKRLTLHGVDVTVSSLGRFQDKPCFVLGAQYPDETRPQVWIDKETFIPFRWIVTGKTKDSAEDLLEVRYLDWRRVGKKWYPMHIEFYSNDMLVREIKVLNIEVSPLFSKDLFDINHLKSIYAPVDTAIPKSGDAEQQNEVQKTIEEFKKIYE
ncbi:MAG: hypothetical protein KKH68_10725 [Proteobacteria bacterium]|nr:hypothetical protein [Pseudomonadota bacterium]